MPNPTPWQHFIRLIENGMVVDASTTNAPTSDLVQRTQHLKDLLDTMGASEALYLRGINVAEDVKIGQPVYLNEQSSRYELAKIDLDYDADGNWGVPSKSSYTWGIVVGKPTQVTANIVTAGVIRNLDLSEAMMTGEVPETGAYFLSAREPGKLERIKPPSSAFVCYNWLSAGLTLVNPAASRGLEDHVHYRFQLAALPAGTPNNPEQGDKHAITTPDPTQEGWLPADHANFQDMAPTGAKFGYNLTQHPELAAAFPPLPLDSYLLEVYGMNWGTSREAGEAIKVDANGIWWMLDDYGWAPWSISYWDDDPGAPAAGGDPAERPAPIDLQPGSEFLADVYELSIYLWFTRVASKTNEGLVASLNPSPGSPIRVLDCNSQEPASTGHLRLALDLQLNVEGDNYPGGQVLKEVEGTAFQKGWAVAGIKSANSGITITGGTEVGDYRAGDLTLTFNDPATTDRELDILLTALSNAREETVADIMFLSLPTGKNSSIRGKIEIPSFGLSTELVYEMSIKLWVLGTAAGTLPDLTFSYRRIAAPDTVGNLPTSETDTGIISLGSTSISANQYILAASPEFTVAPEETIFFTIGRETGSYVGGDVGLLRMKGVLNQVV